MRRIKKIFVTFLAICMICPCLSVITEAATAELRFADPSTTVGAEDQADLCFINAVYGSDFNV